MTKKEIQNRLDKRCRKEIELELAEGVADGFLEITGTDKEGRTLYRLTQKGIAEVEAQVEAKRS